MSSPIDQLSTVHARVGIQRAREADGTILTLEPGAPLCVHGCVRMAVWVLMADMAGGWDAQLAAGDDWTFTSDISMRVAPRSAPDRAYAASRIVRSGRNTMHTEVVLSDADGREFGLGHAGFSRHARRDGDNPKPTIEAAAERWGRYRPLSESLFATMGIEVRDGSRGHVEVELRDELRNPAGIMQGAMVAAVGEAAAEALIGTRTDQPHVMTDLDIRFLSMGRIGPIASQARTVGDHSIAVELFDRGADDRLVSTLLLRAAPVAF